MTLPRGRDCKVCTSKLRNQIEKLMLNGSGAEFVSQWCHDHGFEVSHTSILRHMKNHTNGFETKKGRKTNDTDDILSDDEKAMIEDSIIVDLSEYLIKLGLNEHDLLNIENNLESNIGAFQNAINLIMFKNLAIVDHEITANMNRKCKYPLEKIKGLKVLSDIWFRSNGTDNMVNQNTALETLQKSGYEIKKIIDVDVDSKILE